MPNPSHCMSVFYLSFLMLILLGSLFFHNNLSIFTGFTHTYTHTHTPLIPYVPKESVNFWQTYSLGTCPTFIFREANCQNQRGVPCPHTTPSLSFWQEIVPEISAHLNLGGMSAFLSGDMTPASLSHPSFLLYLERVALGFTSYTPPLSKCTLDLAPVVSHQRKVC